MCGDAEVESAMVLAPMMQTVLYMVKVIMMEMMMKLIKMKKLLIKLL